MPRSDGNDRGFTEDTKRALRVSAESQAMTTDPQPCAPENTEPVEACCKCAAMMTIVDHITKEREALRVELTQLATSLEIRASSARRVLKAAP